jgi:hypothetical protein
MLPSELVLNGPPIASCAEWRALHLLAHAGRFRANDSERIYTENLLKYITKSRLFEYKHSYLNFFSVFDDCICRKCTVLELVLLNVVQIFRLKVKRQQTAKY